MSIICPSYKKYTYKARHFYWDENRIFTKVKRTLNSTGKRRKSRKQKKNKRKKKIGKKKVYW